MLADGARSRFKDSCKRDQRGMDIDFESWEILAEEHVAWKYTAHDTVRVVQADADRYNLSQ